MHPRAKYQRQYQSNPINRERLKETKRNYANATRRLEALLTIKKALIPVNRVLGSIKKPKEV